MKLQLLSTVALFVSFYVSVCQTEAFPFEDTSVAAGFRRSSGRTAKYGGPSIGDLDADGWPDLLFGHHSGRTEVYFNNRNGTFSKSGWSIFRDVHAMTPFRMSSRIREMHFSVSTGGSNGLRPSSPNVFRVSRTRRITDVTRAIGATAVLGRGRSALYLNLESDKKVYPDVIFTNAKSRTGMTEHQNAMRGGSGPRFNQRKIRGFSTNKNHHVMATDVDNDGQMEVVAYQDLQIFKVVSDFKLRDVSSTVLPRGLDLGETTAVAELDFDNDGRWDLFVARTTTGQLRWRNTGGGPVVGGDRLLRNVGGKYVDVTKEAGIPDMRQTRGVTTGDFNNDGWVDILLVKFADEADTMLLNNGDGTFRAVSAGIGRKKPDIRGDGATAVDYDRDGRLDVVVSEGSWSGVGDPAHFGFYRLLRNVAPSRMMGNYLHVRVGSSPNRNATSMHATVRVRSGTLRMWRRVGSPGTGVSVSYIEVVHFGLGARGEVNKIEVRWVDGSVVRRKNVSAGSFITVGVV